MNRDLYRDRLARLDTVVGDGSGYWTMLAHLADEWNQNKGTFEHFREWCDRTHGFRPVYDHDGGITFYPEITDAKKYTLCLLKYSG